LYVHTCLLTNYIGFLAQGQKAKTSPVNSTRTNVLLLETWNFLPLTTHASIEFFLISFLYCRTLVAVVGLFRCSIVSHFLHNAQSRLLKTKIGGGALVVRLYFIPQLNNTCPSISRIHIIRSRCNTFVVWLLRFLACLNEYFLIIALWHYIAFKPTYATPLATG
jgi:hypothetical protein